MQVKYEENNMSPFEDPSYGCLAEANKMLKMPGIDIEWTYDPVKDYHE
jgi:hypothetical protein